MIARESAAVFYAIRGMLLGGSVLLSIGAVYLVVGYGYPGIPISLLAAGFVVYLVGIIIGAKVCECRNDHD